MLFRDDRTKQTWVAISQQNHRRMEKAIEAARRAAWRDLPHNEQVRYLEWAYDAVKKEERTN